MKENGSLLRQVTHWPAGTWVGEGACGRLVRAMGDAALEGSANDPVALPEQIAQLQQGARVDELQTQCAAIELALRLEVGRRVTLASGRVAEVRYSGSGVGEVFMLDGEPITVAELREYAHKSAEG